MELPVYHITRIVIGVRFKARKQGRSSNEF